MTQNINQHFVRLKINSALLDGHLNLPFQPKGIVLFAHGSGSSRISMRNQQVATMLNCAGMATLLIDLLTRSEEIIDQTTRKLRFNIPMLADRLAGAVHWLSINHETSSLKLGLFGTSTCAGAALIAGARYSQSIGAIVSSGGRPDLAGNALSAVQAPTLLIVGAYDEPIIRLNRRAYDQLQTDKKLEIIPQATHLFEEPGALERVAWLAQEWFKHYLLQPESIQ